MKKIPYIFLAPGEEMQQGDETISPFGYWTAIAARHHGQPVTERKAASVRRPIPELLDALKGFLPLIDSREAKSYSEEIEAMQKAIAKAEGGEDNKQ